MTSTAAPAGTASQPQRRRRPQPLNPRLFGAVLDSNALGGAAPDPLVQRIIELAEEHEVDVIVPASVNDEVANPGTPPAVRRRAAHFIFTLKVSLTADELRRRNEIRRVLAGDAKRGKHDQDAIHVFEAVKYGRGYFITSDERIHRKAGELRPYIGHLAIVRPGEFLEIVDAFPPLPRAREKT